MIPLKFLNMQYFYRKALVAFVLLLIADALIACFCLYRSYPSSSFVLQENGAAHWHVAAVTDVRYGGASTVRIRNATPRSLGFDFRLSGAIAHPGAAAALLIGDAAGKPAAVDLSKYSTVTFLAKCVPANSLVLMLTVVDGGIAKAGGKPAYLPVMTYFSCDEKGMPVSLDLTRLTIPEWWYETKHVDVSRRSYELDRVTELEFAASQFSPHEVDSHVEIGDLTLHGRDDRYLAVLAAVLLVGWCVFGIWFFRAQSRALIAKVDGRLKKDLSFVAYRQLTVAPFGDEDEATVLRFIATHYPDSELDLERVAAGTGANRNRINEVLKTLLGMTFTGYLKKLRLTEAARLLTDKADATVAEIARSVGYANSSYFNKLFKEEYGCSPTQFRTRRQRSQPGTALIQSAEIPVNFCTQGNFGEKR
ncbi:MAG: AraC family transcriptional regulator [Pseudomonadota bacterium]